METFRVTVMNDLYAEVIYQMLKSLDFVEIQREDLQTEKELSAKDLLSIPIGERRAYLAKESEKALSFYTESNEWKESQGMEIVEY